MGALGGDGRRAWCADHARRASKAFGGVAATGLAALAMAGIAGPAHAIFFGSSDDRYPYHASPPAPAPAITRQAKPKPPADSLRHKLNIERAEAKRPNELKAKAGQGPLLLVISTDQQKLVLYSNGEAIAESKVSTGVETHPTPTGIFSIIQRNRWHRSNIYSNAPMPYMQRITWSGVALHEGIVPGRPASHGCIRLPQAFAQQLWGTTKLGARVIVTRGEVTPVEFNHPRLAALTRKSDPQITKQKDDAPKPAGETSTPRVEPRAELQSPARTPSAAKRRTASVSLTATDASAEEDTATTAVPAPSETRAVPATIEAVTASDAVAAAASDRAEPAVSDPIETATVPDSIATAAVIEVDEPPYPPALPFDASFVAEASVAMGDTAQPVISAPPTSITVSEFPPAFTLDVTVPQETTSVAVSNYPPTFVLEVALPRDPATFAPEAPFVTADAPDYPPPPLDVVAADQPVAKPEGLALDVAAPGYPPVVLFDAADVNDPDPIVTASVPPAGMPAAKPEALAIDVAAPDYPPAVVFDTADVTEPDPAITASIVPAAKPAAMPVPAAVAEPGEPDASAQAVPPSEGMIPGQIRAAVEIATVLEPYVKPGPVSVFISRKDRKLYVRQGFAPVFDAPVTIAQPELPLGTHIYTAMAVNDDGATMRWSALTMPSPAPKKAEAIISPTTGKRAKAKPAEEHYSYPNAAEALERVTVPQAIAERVFEHMAPGSSLIVSDQGLGPETGRGTDFIVLTR